MNCNKCVRVYAEHEIAANFVRSHRAPYDLVKRCNTCREKEFRRYGNHEKLKKPAPKREGSGVVAPRPYYRGAKYGASWLELGA